MSKEKLLNCDKTCKLKEAIEELANYSHENIDETPSGKVYKIVFEFLKRNELIE